MKIGVLAYNWYWRLYVETMRQFKIIHDYHWDVEYTHPEDLAMGTHCDYCLLEILNED